MGIGEVVLPRRGIPFGQRPGAAREAPRRPRVLSVREAVELANRALEHGVSLIWVEGEVSNLVLARSGHAYFTLKDRNAALPCAMWATSLRRLRCARAAFLRLSSSCSSFALRPPG